jgi:hypothetical protein
VPASRDHGLFGSFDSQVGLRTGKATGRNQPFGTVDQAPRFHDWRHQGNLLSASATLR